MPVALNTLHLFLPFSLPARALLHAAAADWRLFAVPHFIARARQVEQIRAETFARALPHQRWLARCFGVVENDDSDGAPFAPYMRIADQVEAGVPASRTMTDPHDSFWACIEPVHVRIAHDHLVLTEPAQLALSSDEATQLLEAARPVVAALGFALEAPTPFRWYVQNPALTTLNCASPQAAAGRNIDIWLPFRPDTGERSLVWMKLQNEVQMAWFEHPVNHAREARGALPANSIWLHARGCLKTVTCPFTHVYSDQVCTRGLGFAAHAEVRPLPAGFDAWPIQHADALVELDALSQPCIARDGPAWYAVLSELERHWFAPAWAALKSGALRALTLTLTGEVSALTLTATRADVYKFWRRRSFESLFE